MVHSNLFARLAVIAGTSVLVACDESRSEKVGASPAPQVIVVTLKAQPITLTRELTGRTRALLVAEVRPQVGGIVKRRLFVEGSTVKAGQPLYEIDDTIYRADYNSAQAALRKAEATLHLTHLVAARSQVLARQFAVSAQDNEKAAATEVEARADVEVAQAVVARAKANLAYAHIVAPISGRIGKSSITQGAMVTADQSTPLATIQQLDPIQIEMNQPSSSWLGLKQALDAGRIRSTSATTDVRIVLENGSAYGHEGKLQFSDVTVDPTNGNFLLSAVVPNPQTTLLPGMFVRASVAEGTVSNAILVPQQAVARAPKGDATSLVVDKQGRVALRNVRVSRVIGDKWLIDEGLAAGEKVIVEGVHDIKPGMLVRAIEQPVVLPDANVAVR